jgi:hypothetical protein
MCIRFSRPRQINLRFNRRDFLRLGALSAAAPIFDVKLPRGLDFTLRNSPTSQKYLIETMPGGVALFDYNNDGLLDIFLVNGGSIANPIKTPESFDRSTMVMRICSSRIMGRTSCTTTTATEPLQT